jgi:GT2 family glycosyltransferase
MKASIIISVYKNVEMLQLILDSLRYQSMPISEVIISEDGEDARMHQFVASYDWFCPYQHLTQPDLGWRKNRALNRAVVAASHEWLIFIDGDCILHPRFVEMHMRYATPNRILLGKRVKLSPSVSQKILGGNIHYPCRWWRLFNSGCRYADEGIFVPICLNKQLRSTRHLTGCNMSFSRSAILSINGFDEEYVKPAVGEDADIDWRFRAKGYEVVSVRNRAIVYHLYHKESWTEQDENLAIMHRNQRNNQVSCLKGINQHL